LGTAPIPKRSYNSDISRFIRHEKTNQFQAPPFEELGIALPALSDLLVQHFGALFLQHA
jgi:hypothetical protein